MRQAHHGLNLHPAVARLLRRPDGTRARFPSRGDLVPSRSRVHVGVGTAASCVHAVARQRLRPGDRVWATGWPSGVAWLKPTDVYLDSDAGQWYVKGRPVPRADILHIPALVVPGSALACPRWGALARTFDSGYEAQGCLRSVVQEPRRPRAQDPQQKWHSRSSRPTRPRHA